MFAMRNFAFVVLGSLLVSCTAATPPPEKQHLQTMVQQSYDAGEKWLLENIRDKGLFRYIYHPKVDDYPNKNNAIRQLMAARLLAEIVNEKPEHVQLHRRNLQFYLRNWYKEDGDKAYVYYNSKSKLGANAMLLRTLVWSPDFEKHEEEAQKLAVGILSLMNEDGAFSPWYIAPDYDYDEDYLLTFYSGEALTALVEYYEKTGDMDYLTASVKAQDFYINRYVNEIDTYYYPAYVPWHTISLNKLFMITWDPKYAEAAFAMNDKLLEIQDTTNYVGRFYNPATPQYGSPHSSSDGVYTEGLVYAYELAKMMEDTERMQRYRSAIEIAVPNIISMQYTAETAAQFKRPDRAIGAIKTRIDKTGTRVDCVQHTMDAYRKMMEVML